MAGHLLHIVRSYLPRSETFTYNLVRMMRAFPHRFLTCHTENLELFPPPALDLADSIEAYASVAERNPPLAVICHFGPTAPAGLPVARACGVPLIAVFHGYDVSMVLEQPRWIARYQDLFTGGAFGICVSEAGRRRLLAIGAAPDRVSTAHLGVDTTAFAYSPRPRVRPGQPLRLLSVARLCEKKGLPWALYAVARLRGAGVPASLRIVGEGPERGELERIRHELGLESVVEFAGPLDSRGVMREMIDCHILVQPSVRAGNGDEEGIPVVLMEAMALGVPVVSTRHSGIHELVEDGVSGMLTPERDAEALAVAVSTLASDATMTDRIAAAARRRIEVDFNLEHQARRFEHLIADAIGRGRGEAAVR